MDENPIQSNPDPNRIDEHLLTIEQVAARYGTVLKPDNLEISHGLSTEQVDQYIAKYGLNAISPPKKSNPFLQYLHYLSGLFNVMLMFGGFAFVLYGVIAGDLTTAILGVILFAVALLNALIEFVRAYRTASLLEKFLKMIPANVTVIRDATRKIILASQLVPGDLVVLKTGDKSAADIRLIVCKDIKVDNSSLTGESEPQDRSLIAGHENGMEALNIVFNGTLIVNGEGMGIVIRIGDKTALGQIANLTMGSSSSASQLTEEINYFIKLLTTIAILTTIIFFSAGFICGYSIGTIIYYTIGVFISFVPEGLPVTVSILLTIAAKKLAKRNVLVKDLHSIETLGSITILCTDKTGTLTQNNMTVRAAWLNNRFLSFDKVNASESPLDHGGDSGENVEFLLHAMLLCTHIKMDEQELQKPSQDRILFGDATEVGLYRHAMKQLPESPLSLQEKFKKVGEIPFTSATKMHLTLNKYPDEHTGQDGYCLFLKGAPERVFKKSKSIRINEHTLPADNQVFQDFNSIYEKFAKEGQRVLGFAYKKLSPEWNEKINRLLPTTSATTDLAADSNSTTVLASSQSQKFAGMKELLIELSGIGKEEEREKKTGEKGTAGRADDVKENFIFLALVALMDPPKVGVKKALAQLRTAGIQVVMVTGDHPLTATSIARQIGLVIGETAADAGIRLNIPIDSVPESEYNAVIVHGDSIDKLAPSDWDHIFSKNEIVFARTSPSHKLLIVNHAQAKGHVVGVSGDGVNDAPALKKANMGISMNLTASDVTKEAASMILLDDNFCTIVVGIEQGRLLFENLKKSIKYTLTHITPNILSFFLFLLFGLPLPLGSILVLVMDLFSDVWPALSYAWEVPDGALMHVPPRKVMNLEPVPSTEGFRELLYGKPQINVEEEKPPPKPSPEVPPEKYQGSRKRSTSAFPQRDPEDIANLRNTIFGRPSKITGKSYPPGGYIGTSGPRPRAAIPPLIDTLPPRPLFTRTITNSELYADLYLDQRRTGTLPLGYQNTLEFEWESSPLEEDARSDHYQSTSMMSRSMHRTLTETLALNKDFVPLTRIHSENGSEMTIPSTKSAEIVKIQPKESRYSKVTSLFSRGWHFLVSFYIRKDVGEVLVDRDLLLWSYLQGGIIVTVGAIAAYLYQLYLLNVPFTNLYGINKIYFKSNAPPLLLSNGNFADASMQLSIQGSGQSAYYAGIVIGQIMTLFLVKKRYGYPWGWSLFKNWRSLVSILFSTGIAGIVIYVPFFNDIIGNAPAWIIPLLFPLGNYVLYYSYEVFRRFLHFHGWFGGMPPYKGNEILDLVKTSSTENL